MKGALRRLAFWRPGRPAAKLAWTLVERADRERDRRRHIAAAVLYEEALRLLPDEAGVRIQCGHMFKEAGELDRAEAHYLKAQERLPDDAELALQLGHFYKVAGRPAAAEAAYRRALALRPGWDDPAAELARLAAGPGEPPEAAAPDGLAPELFPGRPVRASAIETLRISRLGARRERTARGFLPTLRGVEAIRGVCFSSAPIDQVRIELDGRTVLEAPPVAVDPGPEAGGLGKYVFNLWLDTSGFAPGLRQLDVGCLSGGRLVRSVREAVTVAAPLSEQDYPDSDAVVSLNPADPRGVEAQVNSRPSMVRPAIRSAVPADVRRILVLRADQLGDLVISLPAVRRLRELFPGARLTGLLSAANADLGRASGAFDEVIAIDFPEDARERRRVMPAEAQADLKQRLQAHGFDIAIDLSESGASRPLLLLSGARFLYGFHDRDWPWLSAGFERNVHDPAGRLEAAAASTKVLALVESLGALRTRARIERRPELHRARLTGLGLGVRERYVLLHAGARLGFSRWPHYGALVARLLEATDLRIVLMTDGATSSESVPEELHPSDRLHLIDGPLAFDEFDALTSFAEVFVGNDSGPKHLAALRGVPVVSLHSARLNWNEWGQELTGRIISRRVPCAGCALSYDADECGKDFACIRRIGVEEVFQAVMAELGPRSGGSVTGAASGLAGAPQSDHL